MAVGVGGGNEGGGRSKMRVKIRNEREKQVSKIKQECNLAQPVNELRNVFNSVLCLLFHKPKTTVYE